MFALWYGTIFYSQYKNVILEKLRKKPEKSDHSGESSKAVGTASRIPIADPKVFRPVSPQIINSPPTVSPLHSPLSQSPIPPTSPKIESPKVQVPVKLSEPVKPSEPVKLEPVKLEPPTKPPRSPSPHPLRTDAFEEIEYEDEEEEEEEGSTDGEENSVISSSPRRNQLNSTPNEQRRMN